MPMMSSVLNICFYALLRLSSSHQNHQKINALSKHVPIIQKHDDDDATVSTNTVYISQTDIESGTFRITESGTYILSQDLKFNFNAPSTDDISDETWSPNNYDTDNMPWFPSSTQQNDYDGLYTYNGLYSLGFFAGITVESDDVIIDLNGHSIEMAYSFYVQQRFFSLIELGNRQFIAGKGVSSYDNTQEIYPSTVQIKNGLLGLTSHHAIHGNNVNGLIISDVTMHNFDVAGFACNGCQSVSISDAVVGPQNTNIPVLGRYTHARALLPRLRDLADNYGTETVQFADRDPNTVQDLIDRLIHQMDMVYNTVIHSQTYQDDEWETAKALFMNPSGLLDGGSSYGLSFNGEGVGSSAIGTFTEGTTDIMLTNVEVQGIYISPIEKFKLTDNSNNTIRLLFGDTIDCLAVFDQIEHPLSTKYIGDAYTDLIFVMDKLIDADLYLNELKMNDGLRRLVFNGDATIFASEFNIYGSTDIQLQSAKGAIGIRMDGVQNFKIQSSSIHNVENWGARGSKLAGEYMYPSILNEDEDIQYGYTANRAQGIMVVSAQGSISNLEIYDVNSHSGSSHGVIVYDGSQIGATNVRIRNVQAGSGMTQQHIDTLTLPNIVPLSCSIEIRGSSSIYSTVDRDDLGDLTGHFIIGFDLCSDDDDAQYNRIGQCEWCYNRNANADLTDNGGVIIVSPKSRDKNSNEDMTRQLVEVASDCTNLDDGLQYILPDPSIGTVIPVTCNDGWTMLDGSLTPNIYDYFTSYSLSHRDPSIILPNTDDHTSWRDWFIPADTDTLFRVSIDCRSCLPDDNSDTMWGDNTAYYATGDYLCFYIRKTGNICSYSDIYCNVCDDPNMKTYEQPFDPDDEDGDTYPMWEQCKYVRFNSDVKSNPDHYYCTHREPFVWPALGSDGSGCTCYKPSTSTSYTISLAQAVGQFETEENVAYTQLESSAEYLYIELNQNDFMEGTYRITNPGTYTIMEDIVFDFNAPSLDLQNDVNWSPNDFNEDGDVWWWPRKDQEVLYPGASTFYNPFTLGYFAGISVECSDVIIDLNGYTLEMSASFYLQQRFFSLIELANRPFAPGKGAANWGWIEHYASNVVVRNGYLGLSSHHCLHGNFLNNVLVDNVFMSQFDVAGFGCGQCIKVTLNNVDIGPQHQSIPVLGRYTHARAALPRLQYLMENYGDWQVPFWDRTPTITSLVERLINQMDLTYNYVINGIQPKEDDDNYGEWLEASKLFINSAGYQDASASYGIVFAGGAAVSAIGTRIENEGDITMNNVNVHGLRSHVMEKYKVYGSATTVTMRGFFRDTFDWEAMTDDFSDLENAKYIGNAWEDIMMAVVLNQDISKEWSFLYTTQIEEYVKDWVMTGDGSEETGSNLERWLDIHCGTDIQVHSVKGAIGVRVDGADNLQIDGLSISDVVSTTELGSMRCGEYDAPTIAGEETYIQPGFNGHRAHGLTTVYTNGVIKNINIDSISSNYGNAYGLRVFDGCDIELAGTINVNNINAGTIFEVNQIDMRFMIKSTTNPLPQACGLYLYSDSDNVNYDATTTSIMQQNVIGYRECQETVIRSDQDNFFVSQIIGDCTANCIVKDVYVVDDDIKHSIIIPSILMIFIIASIYVVFRYSYNIYPWKGKAYDASLGKLFNHFANTASEKTPLLTATK